jgi:hypothetical protein
MPWLDAYLTLTVWEFVTAMCSGVSPSKYVEGQIGQQVDADQGRYRLDGYVARLWPVVTLRTPALSSVAGVLRPIRE